MGNSHSNGNSQFAEWESTFGEWGFHRKLTKTLFLVTDSHSNGNHVEFPFAEWKIPIREWKVSIRRMENSHSRMGMEWNLLSGHREIPIREWNFPHKHKARIRRREFDVRLGVRVVSGGLWEFGRALR